ncbi:MAG TPA: hypothetical protein PKH77_03695 [Anaerolineae bacterium]|nr:hypothetical protein [Anaerolineae bacterium]
MKRIKILVLLVTLTGLFLGCTKPGPEDSPIPTGSPLATPVSPIQTASLAAEPKFRINEPLTAGTTQVSGQGPANTPIVIVDVTMSALPLGSAIISPDGTFVIDLVDPLILNHRIGIAAGMVGGTPEPSTEAYIESLKPYRGDGFMNVPYIGVVFASALVE